jgi:two-component system nitrogen regulation response regulator GlnG
LPPLRERPEDIPPLVDHFIHSCREELGTSTQGCSQDAMELLSASKWPGNVRELENAIQRAALLSPDPMLTPADFDMLANADGNNDDSLEALIDRKLRNSLMRMNIGELDNLYETVLHQMERPLINIVLEKTRSNQVRTAEILGINRNTLRKKIQTLAIDVKR